MLDIRTGPPQRHKALTIVPLLTSDDVELPYTLLADALAGGLVRITEARGGTVPLLYAKNASDRDVLILDGEQLIGALQNRMTSRSILLAKQSATEIPVSCLERGRWRSVSEDFKPAPQHSPAKVRRKTREVEARAAAAGTSDAEGLLARAQGEVWGEIREVFDHLSDRSPTDALDQAFDHASNDIAAFVRSFSVVDGQVGLLGLVNDEPVGLDVIGGRSLYAQLHERLLRGYVLDALEGTPGIPRDSGVEEGGELDPDRGIRAAQPAHAPGAARRFLESVRDAERVSAPSVGCGTYSILTGAVIGGELVDDAIAPARVVHLSAFPGNGLARDHGRRGLAIPD